MEVVVVVLCMHAMQCTHHILHARASYGPLVTCRPYPPLSLREMTHIALFLIDSACPPSLP